VVQAATVVRVAPLVIPIMPEATTTTAATIAAIRPGRRRGRGVEAG
jgi:hypothetical protein